MMTFVSVNPALLFMVIVANPSSLPLSTCALALNACFGRASAKSSAGKRSTGFRAGRAMVLRNTSSMVPKPRLGNTMSTKVGWGEKSEIPPTLAEILKVNGNTGAGAGAGTDTGTGADEGAGAGDGAAASVTPPAATPTAPRTSLRRSS